LRLSRNSKTNCPFTYLSFTTLFNYLEASSTKEFILKLKICRKETKESNYWLVLIQTSNESLSWLKKETEELIKEGNELIRIFTASIITAERNQKIRKMEK